MRGRDFLDVARSLVLGSTEAHWRATVIHAYYALMLECRDALTRWSVPIAPRQNVHSAVRLRFLFASDADLKQIGFALDDWVRHRNDASYNLTPLQKFASDNLAQTSLIKIAAALTLLAAIDADPTRRVAAIASFPP